MPSSMLLGIIVAALVLVVLIASLRVVREYERLVIFRLGRLRAGGWRLLRPVEVAALRRMTGTLPAGPDTRGTAARRTRATGGPRP